MLLLFYVHRTIELYDGLWQNASMREPHHPAREDISLPSVLYALSDPTRLRIVQVLARQGERPCGTFDLPIAKATVSHHFKVLREAGVVQVRCEGTQRVNSLRRDDLEARFPGMLDAIINASRRFDVPAFALPTDDHPATPDEPRHLQTAGSNP